MPNTLVPPDGGTYIEYYREVETHDWYSRLSEADVSILNRIVIGTDGWGRCSSNVCSRSGRLYYGKMLPHSEPLVCSNACFQCTRRYLAQSTQALADLCGAYGFDRLMPSHLIPRHTDTRGDCAYCNEMVFEATDQNMHARNLVGVQAHSRKFTSDEVLVHENCSFMCGMCRHRFVHIHQNANRYNNRSICDDCKNVCADSDDIHECEGCLGWHDELDYSDHRNEHLCNVCYDQEIECGDCGHYYHESDDHVCYMDSSGIYGYQYKPDPRFYGQDTYYFGLELEVEDEGGVGCKQGANIVKDALGERAYLKYDASLNNGFEIVSHPHSFNEFKLLNWDFMRELRRFGFRSWDTETCGIHLHISRTAFKKDGRRDEAHELRFQKLVYDNAKSVCKIAGRTSSYARFDDKGKLVSKVKLGQTADRYEAINITNDHTLEIRVFRGSLKTSRVLSAIEFVHSAVEYTRNMKITPKENPLSWHRFVAYVVENRDRYENFAHIASSSYEYESEEE